MCELLVGLPAVEVLGVGRTTEVVTITVRLRDQDRRVCDGCGQLASPKDTDVVTLVDLPCFGRRTRLEWVKRRWQCRHRDCLTKSWTETCEAIAAPRLVLTDRAGRWVCEQVGRCGRTIGEVADELGADWHTINRAVAVYGGPLIDDPARVGEVTALGLDEILAVRRGEYRAQRWSTVIVDVAGGQLLEMVDGRHAGAAAEWLSARPAGWLDRIEWACLDLSGTYRSTFDTFVPDAVQVADPFHVVRAANTALDDCRRRVQNNTLGHRGRRDDPLYRARRHLTIGSERLTDTQRERVLGLLEAGDPHGEVRMAWHTKETLRGFYHQPDETTAEIWLDEFIDDTTDPDMPLEVQRLGRTIRRWRTQVLAWHRSRHTNGPTESMNNLIKRIKRVAFGFRNMTNFRIRALLYAGRPNWDLLTAPMSR